MTELLVLDMAGTVVNEDNLVYKTVLKSIQDAGFQTTLDHVLSIAAGKEKLQAIKDVLKDLGHSDADAESIHSRFKQMLEKAYQEEQILPQNNAINLFQWAREKNIKVVVNTGYDSNTAYLLLQRLVWSVGETIDGLVTASDVQNGRPAPDMILMAMDMMDVDDPGHVIKVGDSVVDIVEGQNANCGLSIGITTGAQDRAFLQTANPDYVIDDLWELTGIVG